MKAPKAPKKSAAKKAASAIPMSEVMDSILLEGGAWEEMTEKVQGEATRQGIDPKKYTTGTIRTHAKFRIGRGTLAIAISDKGASPSKAKAKKAKKD